MKTVTHCLSARCKLNFLRLTVNSVDWRAKNFFSPFSLHAALRDRITRLNLEDISKTPCEVRAEWCQHQSLLWFIYANFSPLICRRIIFSLSRRRRTCSSVSQTGRIGWVLIVVVGNFRGTQALLYTSFCRYSTVAITSESCSQWTVIAFTFVAQTLTIPEIISFMWVKNDINNCSEFTLNHFIPI